MRGAGEKEWGGGGDGAGWSVGRSTGRDPKPGHLLQREQL